MQISSRKQIVCYNYIFSLFFIIAVKLMSLQFKKKRRSANLIQNNDISSEDEVSIVTNESKKPKV